MGDNHIRVICRLRPLNSLEMQQGGQCCVTFGTTNIKVKIENEDNKYDFNFDRIFGPESTQKEVFEFAAVPVIASVLNGFNGTIFAYGQTSSGKTFTMEGYSHENEQLKGIIPRVMDHLFQQIIQSEEHIEFQIKVSFMELYNEKINDLLDSIHIINQANKQNLQVKEDKNKGIFVQDVTEIYVASAQQMLNVMKQGTSNRTVAATRMNDRSSRSHSIFQIQVYQKNTQTDSSKHSKLYFVDLAGSEKISKTNVVGQQLEEAKKINQSLTTLGMVINSLVERKDHIPYRDSKLTRVLQESLGGNSKTTLIIAASMCTYNDKETLGTLRFGQRAKSIKNKAVVNEEKSAKELQILLEVAEKKILQQSEMIKVMEETLKAKGVDKPIFPKDQSSIKTESSSTKDTIEENPSQVLIDQVNEQTEEQKKNQKNQAIKLLNQQLQLIQQKEEIENLIQTKQNLEKQYAFLQEENSQFQAFIKQQEESFRLNIEQSQINLKKAQFEIERIILDQQDASMKLFEFQHHLKLLKQDLNFIQITLSIKGTSNLQDNQDRAEADEVLIKTILKVLSLSEEMDQFIQTLLNNAQTLPLVNQLKQNVDELFSTEPDDDIKITTGRSEGSKLEIQEKSIIQDDDKFDDQDVENILQIIGDKSFEENNLTMLYDLIKKQKKSIKLLNSKCQELMQNWENDKSKLDLKIQQLIKSKKELKKSLNDKVNELKKQIETFALQMQEKGSELFTFRQKSGQDLKCKQQEIQMLKIQIEGLEKMLSGNANTKKVYDMDKQLKQLIQERQQMFNTVNQQRQEMEQARKYIIMKDEELMDMKVNMQQISIQLKQSQIQIVNQEQVIGQLKVLKPGQFVWNDNINPNKQNNSVGIMQALGMKQNVCIPIKGGGGNLQTYLKNNQQLQTYNENSPTYDQQSIRMEDLKGVGQFDVDNSFYSKVDDDANHTIRDIIDIKKNEEVGQKIKKLQNEMGCQNQKEERGALGFFKNIFK